MTTETAGKTAMQSGRRRTHLVLLLLCSFIGLAAVSPVTPGVAASITMFSDGLSSGSHPSRITVGPDGNLWFTGGGAIGKITPSGTITEYTAGLNPESKPVDIVTGPDGNLWFTDSGFEGGTPAIGRITPSGTITQFSSGVNQGDDPITLQGPTSIVPGPDGNLWFGDTSGFFSTDNSSIGRITPSGMITVFELPDACTMPRAILVGPDDNLWFVNGGKGPFCGGIGRITTSGTITEFDIFSGSETGAPRGLVVGPDDNLWFTGHEAIGRMTTTGTITAFSAGLSDKPSLEFSIIVGPDGNLWFIDNGPAFADEDPAIGRITPSGTITLFPTTHPERWPAGGIITGPDGNLWFSYREARAIGRITTDGMVTNFSEGLMDGSDPFGLTVGPQGSDIWFTDLITTGDKGAIGRIAPVGPAGVSPDPMLTIVTEGNGSVSSTPVGISCGSTCAGEFGSGTVVTLTATPAPGSVFKGWNEGGNCPDPATCNLVAWQEGRSCSGTGPCELTLGGDSRVSALFAPVESGGSDSGGDGPLPSGSILTPPPTRPAPGKAFFANLAQVKGAAVLIRARCAGRSTCHGVARLIARANVKQVVKHGGKRRVVQRSRNVVIGKSRFNIAPGRARMLRIRLTGEGKRLIRQHGSRNLRARLAGRGLQNRAVTLRSPKRRAPRHR